MQSISAKENNYFSFLSLFSKDPTSENIEKEARGTYLNLADYGVTRSNVYFIDTIDSPDFELAKKCLLNAKRIGFDGEFLPQLTKLEPNSQSLALLQLATDDGIFLLNSVELSKEKQYQELVQTIFEDKNILKIGHTISGDIGLVASTLKGRLNACNLLDLQKVHKKYNPRDVQSSLSYIAKVNLGKSLCKGEQISNWARRPLREGQLHYAAMDALVSILIHNKYLEVLGEEELKSCIYLIG